MRIKDKRSYYVVAQSGMVINAIDPESGAATRHEATRSNQVFAIPVGRAVSEPTSAATSVLINGVATDKTSTLEYPNAFGLTDLYTVYSGMEVGDIVTFNM